ncbi:probable peroxygenase 5 isoform X1 [Mangifera indica]|uniref:probable peroxygenase 5 isoform X1 n=1 Tax=Mangifera indica TaxID=29780 RepID=UPI001CFBB020|nr:probable peroxygenase 5 isoform X1 [Mangifera indica]
MSFWAFSFFVVFFMASSAFSAEVEQYVPAEQDVLQRHVSFFDRNHDGIIYPSETVEGMKAIGINPFLAQSSAALIHMAISPVTTESKLPDVKLPIVVKNIAKGKHGSDSGTYDAQGRFVPAKFEEIFSKHAHAHDDSLTSDELMEMLKTNRQPNDFKGWVASFAEWKLLYDLSKDKDGLLHKDTVRAIYDGSLFYQLEKGRK